MAAMMFVSSLISPKQQRILYHEWGDFNIYIQPKFYEDIQLNNKHSKPIQQRLGLNRIYVLCRENISVANYAFLGSKFELKFLSV